MLRRAFATRKALSDRPSVLCFVLAGSSNFAFSTWQTDWKFRCSRVCCYEDPDGAGCSILQGYSRLAVTLLVASSEVCWLVEVDRVPSGATSVEMWLGSV